MKIYQILNIINFLFYPQNNIEENNYIYNNNNYYQIIIFINIFNILYFFCLYFSLYKQKNISNNIL